MKPHLLLAPALAIVFAASTCDAKERANPLLEAGHLVVPAAGVTAEQAHLLASMYALCYISGCGGTEAPVPFADHWEALVRFGVVGTPAGAIHIDRRTAKISYRGKPSIYPKEFLVWAKRFERRRQTPNHAMQPTPGRRTAELSMIPTSTPAATRALASGG